MINRNFDIAIIGGGMVGLCIAYQILKRGLFKKIVIIEKENKLGMHSSGRNSGVLHSGLYYQPNTLKAKVCISGARKLKEWISENNIPINNCGKVVIPQRLDLDKELDLLFLRGQQNGVKIQMIDEKQLNELAPLARSASGRALWSPNTSVVNPIKVINKLKEQLIDMGVVFYLAEISWVKNDSQKELILTNGETINFSWLINSSGLNADKTEYEVIGKVGDIAPDESIWSARFVGDKAYIVTFRNIDPLWTIDLTEPTNPRVIGELKVPGVSTYIHPVGDTHLLTIGIAGDDDGLDWGVTQISFFDVSDFSNPILESSLKLNPAPNGENGWSYSHSEATYEHKAFQYWEDDGLLAIPMSTSRWYQDTVEEDGKMYHYHGYEYISKLMLINATPGKSLGIYSENIDHSSYYGSRYSWDSPDIKRSMFMGGGDYIYAISEKAVTAHNVATMEKTGFTELPSNNKPVYEPYY